MSYKFLTKQRKGTGRKAIEPPAEYGDSVVLRLARTKESAQTDQTSAFLFNAGLLDIDLDERFNNGFHVQLGSDYANGMIAVMIRDDMDFEIIPPTQKTDDDGNLLWEDDGITPLMSQERVVSRGKDVYNARRASDESAYHSISSGGSQLAQTFGQPRGTEVWIPLEYNDEMGLWEGNYRGMLDPILEEHNRVD